MQEEAGSGKQGNIINFNDALKKKHEMHVGAAKDIEHLRDLHNKYWALSSQGHPSAPDVLEEFHHKLKGLQNRFPDQNIPVDVPGGND